MPTRVLVADDSPTIRRRAATTLGEAGYAVTCVEDGEAAWAALESGERFGVVLCDILMPGLDGYEVCRRVKSEPRHAALPVLLLRGTFEPWDQARAETVGADGFITKPFDAEAVLSTVAAVLAEAAAAAGSAPESSPFEPARVTASAGSAGDDPFGSDEPLAHPDPEASATWSPEIPAEAAPGAAEPVAVPDEATPFDLPAAGPASVGPTAEPEWDPGAPSDVTSGDGVGRPGDVTPLLAPRPMTPGSAVADEPTPAAAAEAIWSPHEKEAEPLAAVAAEPSAPFASDDPFELGDDGPPPAAAPRPAAPRPAAAMAGAAGEAAFDDALIERLAERVVARLTAERIERIAWDVVPEVAEALIRKRLTDIEARLADE